MNKVIKTSFCFLSLLALSACGVSFSHDSNSSSGSSSSTGGTTSLDSGDSSNSGSDSTGSSSIEEPQQRKNAKTALGVIQTYQESASFVSPMNEFMGSGYIKLAAFSNVNADTSFSYSEDDEFFHCTSTLTLATGEATVESWVFKGTSNRSTYIYSATAGLLTKTYTKTAYTATAFSEVVANNTTYKAVESLAKDTYSYSSGLNMVNELGSTYSEDSIESESYSITSNGNITGTISINDGNNNVFSESFKFSSYLGYQILKSGKQSGADVNTKNRITWGSSETATSPDLTDYTDITN